MLRKALTFYELRGSSATNCITMPPSHVVWYEGLCAFENPKYLHPSEDTSTQVTEYKYSGIWPDNTLSFSNCTDKWVWG